MKPSKEFKAFLKKPILTEGYVLRGSKTTWYYTKDDDASGLNECPQFYIDTFPCGITVTYSPDFFKS